jgi:hypothetical protein
MGSVDAAAAGVPASDASRDDMAFADRIAKFLRSLPSSA